VGRAWAVAVASSAAVLLDELLASSGIDVSSLQQFGPKGTGSSYPCSWSSDGRQQWHQLEQQPREDWHCQLGWQQHQVKQHQAMLPLPAATARTPFCEAAAAMLSCDGDDCFVPPSLTDLLMDIDE